MKRLIIVGLMASTAAFAAGPTREGTAVVLSPSDIADLKQWVENAKQDLNLLQDDIRRDNLEKRRKDIVREFDAVVERSGHKENELLMRYTLNRALEINELVGANPAPSELQSLVAFLDSTIELSKGFYMDDQKYLEAIGRGDTPQLQTPMAVFAYQYAQMILQFSRTFLSPSLEYQVTYKALGWLANDLNSPRNLARIQFSESITRIARLQAKYPQVPEGSDQTILQSIRQFKWEYRERVLKHIAGVNSEIRDAVEKAEKERQETVRLARLSEEQRAKEVSDRRIQEDREKRIREMKARGISFVADDEFTVGAEVIYQQSAATITGVFRNGNLSIKLTVYPYNAVDSISPSDLAITKSGFCSVKDFHFCVGDVVYNGKVPTTVTGIYLDGGLALHQTSYPYTNFYKIAPADSALGKAGTCSKTDLRYCVDTRVRYSGKAGQVKGVFENGRLTVYNLEYPYNTFDNVSVDDAAFEGN